MVLGALEVLRATEVELDTVQEPEQQVLWRGERASSCQVQHKWEDCYSITAAGIVSAYILCLKVPTIQKKLLQTNACRQPYPGKEATLVKGITSSFRHDGDSMTSSCRSSDT
jgi:hypothetical protein